MYWYLNKKTNSAEVFSSMTAIEEKTGIKYETLSYNFSRKKEKEFENDEHRIVKTKIIKSKRG